MKSLALFIASSISFMACAPGLDGSASSLEDETTDDRKSGVQLVELDRDELPSLDIGEEVRVTGTSTVVLIEDRPVVEGTLFVLPRFESAAVVLRVEGEGPEPLGMAILYRDASDDDDFRQYVPRRAEAYQYYPYYARFQSSSEWPGHSEHQDQIGGHFKLADVVHRAVLRYDVPDIGWADLEIAVLVSPAHVTDGTRSGTYEYSVTATGRSRESF